MRKLLALEFVWSGVFNGACWDWLSVIGWNADKESMRIGDIIKRQTEEVLLSTIPAVVTSLSFYVVTETYVCRSGADAAK